MDFSDDTIRTILLDIVSIVAVLGGGTMVRVAQQSGLTWQHVLPRLMPAPQTLIKEVREQRLPTERGTVVGVYSGRPAASDLNFFAALLHPGKMKRNQVELVEVTRKEEDDTTTSERKNVYCARELGPLIVPSLLGVLSAALIAWRSIRHHDMFALAATVLLSVSSSVVGLASWWNLDLKQKGPRKGRETKVPQGDVVIHYARLGAFRVVKCDEKISELYFRIELCDYVLGEAAYRAAYLFATVLLLSGLICLRNSKPELQIAFAISYIVLNIFYWICSALDPAQWHWSHDYIVKTRKWQPSGSLGDVVEASRPAAPSVGDDVEAGAQIGPKQRRFSFSRRRTTMSPLDNLSPSEPEYTDALWTAIALVGHSRWVHQARVAPETGPWKQWLEEAGNIAATWQAFKTNKQPQHATARASREYQELLTAVINKDGTVQLPAWDYQKRLTDLLASQPDSEKRGPDWPGIIDLQSAGYIPKKTAEAQPLAKSHLQGHGQGASSGIEPHDAELQTSRSSNYLAAWGSMLRPRGRSPRYDQRTPVAEVSPARAEVTSDHQETADKDKVA